jgi:hypothetical protein
LIFFFVFTFFATIEICKLMIWIHIIAPWKLAPLLMITAAAAADLH